MNATHFHLLLNHLPVLQPNTQFSTSNSASVTNLATVVGTNRSVNISPLTGTRYFRLIRP